MLQFMIAHQLNIMQMLTGICGLLAFLILLSKALTKKRRQVLILMQLTGMFLITFDRLAYIYSGDTSRTGFIMVRLCNFVVFFLTSEVVLAFNLYLSDLLVNEGGQKVLPKRISVVNIMAIIGMLLIIINLFTGIIYYFDELNRYHRAPWFIVCYIIPVVGPLIQFSVILQYRKCFNKIIFYSLLMYIIVPIIVAVIQIFTYGVSLTNMAIVLVSVFLYVFAYFDINESVRRAHEAELKNMKEEQDSIKRLFDQTATAFVTAIETKDVFGQGHALRVALQAKEIAKAAKKSDEECEMIYYSALLHDVGMIGIADSEIEKADMPGEEDNIELKKKPEIGGEILSNITEYPLLKLGARYSCERYDGKGYPEGLKGENIPDVARIVAVANAYDTMTSRKKYRNPLPAAIVREEFVKEAGIKYDPEYSRIMVEMMDSYTKNHSEEKEESIDGSVIECCDYRSSVSAGINITRDVVKISFRCIPDDIAFKGSVPSVILYDSLDARVHNNARSIESYKYIEYGEIWFDGHMISTDARNMMMDTDDDLKDESFEVRDENTYELFAARYEDHLKINMITSKKAFSIIVALQDSTKASYIGITGEHCRIDNIVTLRTGDSVHDGDIKRIADEISYINRIESDIPNVQIDRTRSAYSKGIAVKDGLRILFHTMSLPTANLVWHCPYIVFYSSDDNTVTGSDYREYEMIKLNGENDGSKEFSTSRFAMKKDGFVGWEDWKNKNKEGLECILTFTRRANRITMTTSNLGISIQSTVEINDGKEDIYVALTGDQCAITDIRIKG